MIRLVICLKVFYKYLLQHDILADNEYLKPVSETQSSQEDKTKKLKYGNKKHLKTLDDDVYQQKNSLLKCVYYD